MRVSIGHVTFQKMVIDGNRHPPSLFRKFLSTKILMLINDRLLVQFALTVPFSFADYGGIGYTPSRCKFHENVANRFGPEPLLVEHDLSGPVLGRIGIRYNGIESLNLSQRKAQRLSQLVNVFHGVPWRTCNGPELARPPSPSTGFRLRL
jgi:hypothetical protein